MGITSSGDAFSDDTGRDLPVCCDGNNLTGQAAEPGHNKYRTSHPHRHQHIQRGALVILPQQSRRGGVGQVEFNRIALHLL